jgi:hypothetical protein
MDNAPFDLLLLVEAPVLIGSFLGGRNSYAQHAAMVAIGVWGVVIHQHPIGNHVNHHLLPNTSFAPIFPWLDVALGTNSKSCSTAGKCSTMVLTALVVAYLVAVPVGALTSDEACITLSLMIASAFIATLHLLQCTGLSKTGAKSCK